MTGRGRARPAAAILLMLLGSPPGAAVAAPATATPSTPAPVAATPAAPHAPAAPPPPARSPTEMRPAYVEAMRKARAWLDDLKVDPADLRAHGIKGKKKLTEQLESYYRLWKVAPAAERPALLARIKTVVAVTYTDGYHDMATTSDLWFKEDATSYLRAAFLMDRTGLDTARYRREIAKIQPRLDAHLARRGPNQQMAFDGYYRYFGLKEPFPLGQAQQRGVIAERIAPAVLSEMQAYDLTHEVYAPYDYGDRLDVDPFSETDKTYLRGALTTLATRYQGQGNSDLVSEMVECMHYLRFDAEPAYASGVAFLLHAQNADGSWGSYERQREVYGDYVRQGWFLHTTLVAILALTAVFDEPMPRPAHAGAGV